MMGQKYWTVFSDWSEVLGCLWWWVKSIGLSLVMGLSSLAFGFFAKGPPGWPGG